MLEFYLQEHVSSDRHCIRCDIATLSRINTISMFYLLFYKIPVAQINRMGP